MQAWLAESRARKERRRAEIQKPKWDALSRLAFWRHSIRPVPPVATVKSAGASK